MKEFGNLASFAAHVSNLEAGVVFQLHNGLKKVSQKIEKTAKDSIGTYQGEIGPYPAWESLSEATQEDRIRKGFSPDDPLLRTGELRDSISHQTHGLEAEVGSTSDVAVYQELGTDKIPPRPFLGPAVEHNHDSIKRIIGGAVVTGILGGGLIPANLEYDHKI